MELWVRSQDKERLTKITDLRIYYATQEKLWVIEDCDDLGYYKSKKRTLEILDEIQNILKPTILLKRNDDNDKELLGALQKGVIHTQKIDMDFKELTTYVYEMPKE